MGVRNSEEFISETILRHNLYKMRLVCKTTTVILLALLIVEILMLEINSEIAIANHLNFTPYLSIIFFNTCGLIYTKKYFSKGKEHVNHIDKITNLYTFFLLASAVFISISDQSAYNQLMLFTLVLLISSSYFILEKKQILIPITVNGLVLIIGLYVQHGYSSVFQNQLIYLAFLLPVAYFISNAFYRSYLRSLKVQVRLIEEIDEKRQLAKELKEANRKLSLQSSLDPLTKIYNRKAINEYIEQLALRTTEMSLKITTIMLDVDYFKMYNDTYGHLEGDKVLVQIGEVLKKISKKYGVFTSRWGGEEFMVILLNANEQEVKEVCEDIMTKVAELEIEHKTSEVEGYITVSIGAYTQIATSHEDVLESLQFADSALYDVKRKGRNDYKHKIVTF